MKLNLQLFASIVDYLNSQGKDSSYSARKQLASQYGISNYSGTADQNAQLLKMLQSGTKTTNNTANNTSSNTSNTKTNNASNNAKNRSISKMNGVDQSVMDRMNSQFQVSSAYTEAMAQVQSLLDKINSGKTSYTDQVKGLMDQIQNREDFSYDVDSDQLFQQYLSSMMTSGQTAMQDTMGQASALTGGYGSSYAQSVGNQTYNQYIQGAYDNLPEYYQMAFNQYQSEGEELYKQYSMLSEADAQEYARLMDSYSANSDYANNMYNREYQAWSDDVAQATNIAGMQNSDYWSKKNYDESVRQFNANYSLQQQELELSKQKASSGSNGKEPSEKQYAEILRRLNEEGEDSMYKYIDSLGADIDTDAIYSYITNYGRGNVSGRTFTMIAPDKSKRYAGKVNHGIYRDQYGNDYTLEEIKAIDKNAYEKLKGIKSGQKITID